MSSGSLRFLNQIINLPAHRNAKGVESQVTSPSIVDEQVANDARSHCGKAGLADAGQGSECEKQPKRIFGHERGAQSDATPKEHSGDDDVLARVAVAQETSDGSCYDETQNES